MTQHLERASTEASKLSEPEQEAVAAPQFDEAGRAQMDTDSNRAESNPLRLSAVMPGHFGILL